MALRRLAGSVTGVTVLGHCLLGFEQAHLAPVVGAVTGVTAELVLETVDAWAYGLRPRYLDRRPGRRADLLLPSYVDGLLCAMLLYGDAHLAPVALATLIAVGSRYALRVGPSGRSRPGAGQAPGRPYMNPVALGVTVVPLLFPWVGTAPPYQFTEWVSGPFDVIVPLAVLALGLAVHSGLTGRLPLILGWAGGFVLQGLARSALGDVPVAGALLPMTGVAFVLHTCYVIADTRTTPRGAGDQAVFGLAAAVVYGLLVQFNVVSGLAVSLVVACAGRGALLAVRARVRPPSVPAPGAVAVPAPVR